jgi:hypothetical protein
LPVVDNLAAEYSDRVDFVAPAWKASFEATSARADELFRSGQVLWGLDQDEEVFAAYGVSGQPVTVLIDEGRRIVDTWYGLKNEAEIRTALDSLAASG